MTPEEFQGAKEYHDRTSRNTTLEVLLNNMRNMYESYIERARRPDAATYDHFLTRPEFMHQVRYELTMIRDVQAFVSEWKGKQ